MGYWFSSGGLSGGSVGYTSAVPKSLPSTPTGEQVVSYREPPQFMVAKLQAMLLSLVMVVMHKIGSVFRGQWELFKRYPLNVFRGNVIGVLIGALPGAGADIAAWISYAVSKRFSKERDKFGKGHVEGLVDAGAANNSALGGAWVPALVFGIPGVLDHGDRHRYRALHERRTSAILTASTRGRPASASTSST